MATTLFTTWTRITGDAVENTIALDPNFDLDLTADEREMIRDKALEFLADQVEGILAPFEAQFLANGEIVGPVEKLGEFQEAMENEDGVREEISMIDFSEIFELYAN